MKREMTNNLRINNYLFSLMFVTLFCLSSEVSLCNINKDLIKNESIKTVKELGVAKGPVYLDAIWPDDALVKNKKVNISTIDPNVVEKSVSWIRTIIKDEWIPQDLDKKLIAIKDWKKLEKRNDKGDIISETIGDYLLVEYKIKNYNIQIQENGISIGILILPIDHNEPLLDVENYLNDFIGKFIKFPNQKVSYLKFNIESIKTDEYLKIYYGNVQCEWEPNINNYQFQTWWNYFSVCTDGHFMFFVIPERDGKPFRPQAKPGIPSRF